MRHVKGFGPRLATWPLNVFQAPTLYGHIVEGMKMLREMRREPVRSRIGCKVLKWRSPLEATHGTQTQLHH